MARVTLMYVSMFARSEASACFPEPKRTPVDCVSACCTSNAMSNREQSMATVVVESCSDNVIFRSRGRWSATIMSVKLTVACAES